MPNDPGTWPYAVLKPQEFEYPYKMDTGFLRFLDNVVAGQGWFTKFTSDYRDPAAQQVQIAAGHGAASHSLHEDGKAVDIRMPLDALGKIDYVKLGLMCDAVALYRKGIAVEMEIDITPNDMHIHLGWFGVAGNWHMEPTCRHTGAA